MSLDIRTVKSGPHKSKNGRLYCILKDGKSRMLSKDDAARIRKAKSGGTSSTEPRKATGRTGRKKTPTKKKKGATTKKKKGGKKTTRKKYLADYF